MENPSTLFLLLLVLIPVLASSNERQAYIVYLGEHSGGKTLHEIEENHHSYLLSVKQTEEDARSSLLYSYKHSINGFAAVLTPEEAENLSRMDEVVSIYKSHPRKYSLHTTRSWEFVGVERPPERNKFNQDDKDDILVRARYGKDVIAGLLDTGVWPESRSFSDEGLGPVPKRWKGICQSGDEFNSSHCNKKLIGARYYVKAYLDHFGRINKTRDYLSPRDKDGHGTHTTSTLGGRRVPDASSLGGFARGTATGGAPLVRLAMYKVCWSSPGPEDYVENTCFEADMIAAIDDAIHDGVDLLSISIGATEPNVPYSEDGIAIGALHAIKNKIVVSCSAGNSGPTPSTIVNTPPWIITVSASSIDRKFEAPVKLGNGQTIQGETVTPDALEEKLYPLVRASQVANPDVPKNLSDQCLPGSLSPQKAKGKIVICLRGNGTRVGKGGEVKRAGGIGYILGNSKANGEELSVDAHLLPATAVGYQNAMKILEYIDSAKNPTAHIARAKTVLHGITAPTMAAFTSRGPSIVSPDILKPDITAPGLNVLAAWSEGTSPTKLQSDKRLTKYNIISGTSMASPHIGGAISLLKAIHPTWSSAAIRSAIITTAELRNNRGKPIADASGMDADPFQFGSGHFRPAKAADPGLVYDASFEDYIRYLCSIGFDFTNFGSKPKCPENPPSVRNLNYPSVAIPKLNGTVVIKRTVTNVGSSSSVYFSSVKPPIGFSIKIYPPILYFSHVGQKKSFTITVQAESEMEVGKIPKNRYFFGWLTWSDAQDIHIVRSPLAVALA